MVIREFDKELQSHFSGLYQVNRTLHANPVQRYRWATKDTYALVASLATHTQRNGACQLSNTFHFISVFNFLGMVAPQLEKTDLQGAMQ